MILCCLTPGKMQEAAASAEEGLEQTQVTRVRLDLSKKFFGMRVVILWRDSES